jgi:hypothetical protein
MKKRDKKLHFSKETLRDLTSPKKNIEKLAEVVGGEALVTCIPGGTTHREEGLC